MPSVCTEEIRHSGKSRCPGGSSNNRHSKGCAQRRPAGQQRPVSLELEQQRTTGPEARLEEATHLAPGWRQEIWGGQQDIRDAPMTSLQLMRIHYRQQGEAGIITLTCAGRQVPRRAVGSSELSGGRLGWFISPLLGGAGPRP